jgi:N-acetylglucosaminyldiphosphoundecaprenol N-acetyl-beta-D-mannosaminyltransferase
MCPTEADVPGKRVTVGGVSFDALTEARVVKHVRAALGRGQGGRIVTPNVDILRQIRRDPATRDLLFDDSTLVVADGMPVIWASRLAGTPLPQRVSGADLIWSLSAGLGRDGRSVFVLGGEPAGRGGGATQPVEDGGGWADALVSTPPNTEPAQWTSTGRHAENVLRARDDHASHRNAGPAHRAGLAHRARNKPAPWQRDSREALCGADRAATALRKRCPGLSIAGAISPPYGFDGDPDTFTRIRDEIVAAQPDLILVGIGFPRQELFIDALRVHLPASWFLGCGMAIGFVAGDQRRAPNWMRRAGVEWMHRLASEPHRLAERYLRHDLPFALSLLAQTAASRLRPTRRSGREIESMGIEVRRARHRRERG